MSKIDLLNILNAIYYISMADEYSDKYTPYL